MRSLPGAIPSIPTIPARLAFDQAETAQLLGGISVRQLFNIRNEIGFSRIGSKIVFTRQNLEKYLDRTFAAPNAAREVKTADGAK